MDTLELSAKYLNALYLKSKNDLAGGYDATLIAKLMGLDDEQAKTVRKYVLENGLIEKPRADNDDKIILTHKGVDHLWHLRENRVFKIIKFIRSQFLPTDNRPGFNIIFSYDLIENGNVLKKTIKVSISDVLWMLWGCKETDLEKILLQFAKDEVIKKLRNGSLSDTEDLVILRKNYPGKCPYTQDELIEIKFAEYEIEIGQKRAEPKSEQSAASGLRLNKESAAYYKRTV